MQIEFLVLKGWFNEILGVFALAIDHMNQRRNLKEEEKGKRTAN